MTDRGRAFVPFILTLVVAGCSSVTPTPTPSAGASVTQQPTASPTAVAEVICSPNAGDACTGPMAAGEHASALFGVPLTFEVPAGWGNHADSPGEYVIYAPGSAASAIEGGARDWIAFLEDVTFNPVGCPPQPVFDEGARAADIADWMATRANLDTTDPSPVSIGGLTGLVLDVRLAANATAECFPEPGVFLVHGLGASDGYDQGIGPGVAMRFYFFDHRDEVLMIELDDVSGGDRLDEFSAVVSTVSFGVLSGSILYP